MGNKKDIDKLEEQGLWEASSFLKKFVQILIRKNEPLDIECLKRAHSRIFTIAKQIDIAGKYRQHNCPELKRIDGSILKITDWHNIPNAMSQLGIELREQTRSLKLPKTGEDYEYLISIAARLSHRLAQIHPFENGNGRTSRLLLNAIFWRAGLQAIAIKKSKHRYLRAMCQADDGYFFPLENMIKEGLIDVRMENYKKRLAFSRSKHRRKGNK